MSVALAHKAAAAWGLGAAPMALAARRENIVYRVQHGPVSYALRLHRAGYRSDAELRSELQWMAMLAQSGLAVPEPLPTLEGALSVEVDGVQVDVLHWMDGAPLGRAGDMQGIENRVEFCQMLGREVARLHDVSDAWRCPDGFTRPQWNRVGLLGEAPLWGRFWEHPDLTEDDRALLLAVRAKADRALSALEGDLDYGLIHADLLAENMLWDGTQIAMIDFDDGGFGFRDFELATFLMRYLDAPDYGELRAGLLSGYAGRRQVDEAQLDLFITLRALTYPGWIMARLNEPGGQGRSDRALNTALPLARAFLDKEGAV